MSKSIDKKPMLVKFSQGNTTGKTQKSILSEWKIIYSTINSISGGFVKEMYGIEEDFDLVVVVDLNEMTKQISNTTLFLINEYPTDLNKNGNYSVKKIIYKDNNQMVVGLERKTGISYKNIYYVKDNQICAYQINFDSANKKGYVYKYIEVPFEQNSVLWLYEPESIEDLENRIRLKSITNVGVVDNLKIFKEYSFESV